MYSTQQQKSSRSRKTKERKKGFRYLANIIPYSTRSLGYRDMLALEKSDRIAYPSKCISQEIRPHRLHKPSKSTQEQVQQTEEEKRAHLSVLPGKTALEMVGQMPFHFVFS